MTELQNPGETPVVFHSGGRRLLGILYQPRPPSGTASFVLCNPLFEERKASHGVFVAMARTLARDGHAVLRFDYGGCGNSEGAFRDFSTPEWIEDIVAATHYLRASTRCERVGLIGLRLGASLCAMAAQRAQADSLVLWEPVVNGPEHLQTELRKKLMKEMVTFGRSRATRDELAGQLADGGSVDFDGYELTPALYRDLQSLSLTSMQAPSCRLLCVQVSARKALAGELKQFISNLSEQGADVTHRLQNEKPFWNLIGLTDCSGLIATTREWVAETARGND